MTRIAHRSQPSASLDISPFHIEVPQHQIDDLKARLSRARWPDAFDDSGAYGAKLPWVKDMACYWRESFDWRKQEARLNSLANFTTNIDGQNIHFVHVRSPEPKAFPLIMTHGWPGSFADFSELIGPLTDPKRHGGASEDAFDLVIPSLPGFAFSGATDQRGWNSARTAKAWDELMHRLGYARYGAHGGDLGALVSNELAILAPSGLAGVHVLEVYAFPSGDPKELEGISDFEKAGLDQLKTFQSKAGYQQIQSTRPDTLAYGLADSPVGQLAWSSELFTGFGGVFADIASTHRDLFLTNVSLYWHTGTSASSSRIYYEDAKAGTGYRQQANRTPMGVASFAGNFRSIRKLAERTNNIVHWSVHERGGHFAAIDAPDLLADDLRTFFRGLR